MNMLENLSQHSLMEALGWALIHFIWQGTLVALLLAGVLLMRAWSSNVRYAVACAAMLLMLVLPPTTMTLLSFSTLEKTTAEPVLAARPHSQPLPGEIEPVGAPIKAEIDSAAPQPRPFIHTESLVPLLPWMILVWLLGVIFFSLRLICGWLYTHRLKSYGASALGNRWEQTLLRLSEHLQVMRPVRLLVSTLVGVPTAIGWLRPVILLPASALTGLSSEHLEAIIAHELAHIRRYDYLINLLQALIETLLFYHPAVWWVSRRIRQEREHCCDDLAVAVCGDVFTYARALLEMEQLRAAGPQLAVAANGGLLMNRIQRLLGIQTPQTDRFTGLVAGIILLFGMVSVGVGAQSLLPSSSRDKSHSDLQTVDLPRLKSEQLDDLETLLSHIETLLNVEQLDDIETILNVEQLDDIETSMNQHELLLNDMQLDNIETMFNVDQLENIETIQNHGNQPLTEEQFKSIEKMIEDLKQVYSDEGKKLNNDDKKLQLEILLKHIESLNQSLLKIKQLFPPETILNDEQLKYLEKLRRTIEKLLTDEQKKSSNAMHNRPGVVSGESSVVVPDQTVNPQATATESMHNLNSSDPAERAMAACLLGRTGAVEAIPALINMLGDDTPIRPIKCWDFDSAKWSPALYTFKKASPGEQAAIALASLGRSAVEPLIAALSNSNPSVRSNAAWAIGEIRGGLGTDRSAAVDPLIAALSDTDSWVRVAAAFSLGEMRPKQSTQALITALGDVEWNVREMAARALGEMKARSGIESLANLLLRDENERVRRKAAWALGEIRDPMALDSLTAALNDQDQRVRTTAKWAIGEIRE